VERYYRFSLVAIAQASPAFGINTKRRNACAPAMDASPTDPSWYEIIRYLTTRPTSATGRRWPDPANMDVLLSGRMPFVENPRRRSRRSGESDHFPPPCESRTDSQRVSLCNTSHSLLNAYQIPACIGLRSWRLWLARRRARREIEAKARAYSAGGEQSRGRDRNSWICTARLHFDRFGTPFESMPPSTNNEALQVLD